MKEISAILLPFPDQILQQHGSLMIEVELYFKKGETDILCVVSGQLCVS